MRLALRCPILLLALAGCILLPTGALAVADGSLGVYADATGTLNSVTFSIGVPRTLYVVAKLDGQTEFGLTGAEFRVAGLPADWLVFVTPNPAATVVLGDPFRSSGGVHRANIAFNGCTAGNNGMIVLYTAVVIAQSVVPAQDLTVEAGSPPTNPTFTTPIFTLCNIPDFTKVAAVGEAFHYEVRAPQDLDYSALQGYDSVRGVQPVLGEPGDVFHFRVSYTNADNQLPAAGSPRLELDANGDGDPLDAGEGAFTMCSADQDSNLTNGKEYRYDVALGLPPGGHYRYRFTAVGPLGFPVPGVASTWNDSLFVNAGTPDLVVQAEHMRVFPVNPAADAATTILARIENNSDVAVQGVNVRIEDVFGNIIQERVLAVMGPHSVTDVGCTQRFPDNGFQPVLVRVDAANTIAERDESNNLAARGVLVGSAFGTLQVSGIPAGVTVPPLAPFGLNGHAEYPGGPGPVRPAAGAVITVQPSWEPEWTLHADADGDFAFRITPPAAPGSYTMNVRVSDVTRTVFAPTTVTVTPFQGNEGPHLPNLTAQMTATAGADCPVSSAGVTLQIRNTGDVASAATTVRLLRDGVVEVGVLPVGALTSGALANLGPVNVPLSGAGLHTLTAVIDPGNAQREMREDDNFAFAFVRVQAGCFDLAMTQARITAPDLCTTTPTTLSARVTNVGCGTSQPSRVAALAAGQEFGSAAVGALAPGASADVVFSNQFGLGCNDLSFVADPEGAAGSDCDLSGNTLSLSLCLGTCGTPPPPTFPDFSVQPCDIEAVPSARQAGEPTVFRAWITNHGAADATREVQVLFRVDGVLVGSPVPVGPIAAGSRMLAVASASWLVDFTSHQLVVSIDATGQEQPGGGTDNFANHVMLNLRLAPLSSCGPSGMFSNCTPCPDEPFATRAIVVNDGLFVVDSAVLELREGSTPLGSVGLGALPANGGCAALPAPVEFLHAFSAGVHTLTTTVTGVALEPDLSDNSNTGAINVACVRAADLTASVTLPPGLNPAVGDTVDSASVTVRNLGNASASNVVARLRVDSQILCDLQMGDIGPGGQTTLVCTAPWVVTSTGCIQILEVCADPFSQIGETNESNNCGRTCLTGNPDVDLAIFSSTISVTPPNPIAGQTVHIEVGMYNFGGHAASCRLTAKWFLGTTPFLIGEAHLNLPDGPTFYPVVMSFFWQVPVPPPVTLRFEIENIVPHDTNSNNNVVQASLPWFVPPATPVAVSDLAAVSTEDGVRMTWRCSAAEVEYFRVERRLQDALQWVRLPGTIPANGGAAAQAYQWVDRDAPAGARLEYRLIGVLLDRNEEVLGTLTVQHDVLTAMGVRLLPVRPQPFRAGSSLEFSLPASRNVELQIFDTAGRRVAQLAQGAWPAGRHAVSWNGLDLTNRRVPTGVYFARLVSESYRETRRLVLVH